MEVSYALAPSGDPPPCKRVLTRALEDWDIVTAEAVLEGKGMSVIPYHPVRKRLCNLPFTEPEHQAWIGEHGWELVPLIAGYLTPHTEEAGPHLAACCQVAKLTDQF